VLASTVLGLLSACASPPPKKSAEIAAKDEDSDGRISQTQIQESLQRFVGLFFDRTLQAAEPLMAETAPPKVRIHAIHQILLYASAALAITTERFPETALLDMLVFMDLCHRAITEYWIPEVYGESGRPLEVAFDRNTRELDRLATGIVGSQHVSDVHRLVEEWRRENPGQHRVELVRPFLFAETAGELATEREREASGILNSVKSVTSQADQAMLLAQRVLFMSQRMPFLLRFQVRLGVQEVIQDSAVTLQDSKLFKRADDLRPLVNDASTLAAHVSQVTSDSRAIVDALRPWTERRSEGDELHAERLVSSAKELVREMHSRGDGHDLERAERSLTSANRLVDRSLVLLDETRADVGLVFAYLAALCAALVSMVCAGFVVVHRLTRGHGRDRPGGATPPRAATVGGALEDAHR
jgi:hypothetical protein